MTDSAAAAAAISGAADPAQHLRLVQDGDAQLQRLKTARSDYIRAIDQGREVAKALVAAEVDVDTSSCCGRLSESDDWGCSA
jgi:hypothetical protein